MFRQSAILMGLLTASAALLGAALPLSAQGQM